MSREVIDTPVMRYTVAPDAYATRRRSMSAIVQARLIDELTGQPVTTCVRLWPAGAGFTVAASRSVQPRIAAGGLIALVGMPSNVVADVAGPPAEFGMTVEADGYIPVTKTSLFNPSASLPDDFVAFDLGDIALHRTSVTLAGRVTQRSAIGVLQPVSGASVTVVGIWHSPLPATGTVPPQPADVVSLRTQLYANRTSGADTVQSCTVVPTAAPTARLVRAAAIGDRVLHVTDRIGLVPNATVAVNPSSDRAEFVVISSVDTTHPDIVAGTITLQHPLQRTHSAELSVALCTVSVSGAAEAFAVDAIVGDSLLLLGGVAGLAMPSFVEVAGTGVREYHAAELLDTTSDANGFYRLPGIHRLVQTRIRVTSGASAPLLENVGLDYNAPDQRIDFTFP